MKENSLKALSLKDQVVLLRVDYNVPLDFNQNLLDDTRIKASLPTLNYLLRKGASVVLLSHLGRPGGSFDHKFSLSPIAKHLSHLIHHEVIFEKDINDVNLKNRLKPGNCPKIVLLENLRFYPGEENPDNHKDFVEKLASFGTIFVNDAFAVSHRKHASVFHLAKYFKDRRAFGFLMEKEIDFLGKTLNEPQRPFYAIVGGAKVLSKLGVLKALLDKVDALFIGGAMSYTFLKAKGLMIGDSPFEASLLDEAKNILELAQKKGVNVYLPVDLLIADSFSENANYQYISLNQSFPNHTQGMGIGPKTVEVWSEILKKSKTIFWNGPLGVYEFDFAKKSTEDIAKLLSTLDAITIVGGGDSVAAISKLGLEDKFTHISTGGGASLEFIEHGSLPGIDIMA
jgi:phosphoglycerate kinase